VYFRALCGTPFAAGGTDHQSRGIFVAAAEPLFRVAGPSFERASPAMRAPTCRAIPLLLCAALLLAPTSFPATAADEAESASWSFETPWFIQPVVWVVKIPFWAGRMALGQLGLKRRSTPATPRIASDAEDYADPHDYDPDDDPRDLDEDQPYAEDTLLAAREPARLHDPPYSRRVAVVIGIDRYSEWPALEAARRDASRVSNALQDMGFDEVIELYDEQASRRRILSVLGEDLAAKTDDDSLAVIFFAGHGQTETLASGGKRGYIVPADADPDQVFATSISMSTLREISHRVPARQVYYAMDSCYSGLGLARGIAVQHRDSADYIDKVSSLRAVQMITAGSEGEVALERDGNGLFTRYFLRAIGGEADFNGDGFVTASEIGTYVRPEVTTASGLAQTPQFGTLDGSGEVVFPLGTARTTTR
jgi:hypothetical protein